MLVLIISKEKNDLMFNRNVNLLNFVKANGACLQPAWLSPSTCQDD